MGDLLTNDELDAALDRSPEERVTLDLIHSKIKSAEYVVHGAGTLTICVLTLENGFTVTGQSACANPANYNPEIGRKVAHDNAVKEVWPLEGYLLRQRLHDAGIGSGCAAQSN